VLDHKDVSTVIPGAKTPQQIEEDIKASELPSLTGEEILRVKLLREQGFA
jgi:aryl-alcohol dehydrogenase-like predicted oxidoreductase